MGDKFRFDLIPAGSRVLCALSGGMDSMYLACRLAEGGYEVYCAHYNHHLRPTAHRDEEFVRAWCEGRGIPLVLGGGDVAAESRERGLGLEDCARRMRYAFLEETADALDCPYIATGHHAGDNAETVLMNLIRGTGLKGLCGIPERRGRLVRPMLEVEREEIGAYLAEGNIPHVEDETNGDERYTRNKVRGRLIPLLEELNPRAVAHIGAAARRLREDGAALDGLARTCAGEGTSISLRDLPEERALALRVVFLLAERAGLTLRSVHGEAVLALCERGDPSARLDVPGGRVRREYDRLVFSREESAPEQECSLPREGSVRWGGWTVSSRPEKAPAKAYLSPGSFYLKMGEYTLRSRREGDRLRLGSRPEKTVKKLMIDEKIPAGRRGCIPVLDGGGEAAALGGFGPDSRFLAQAGEDSLHITMTEENE